MEDELDDAGAVAQVDEDQAAVVAAAVDPAGDPRLGVDPVGEHLRRTRCRGSRWPLRAGQRSLIDASPPVISSTRSPRSTGALLAARHVAQLRGAVGLEDQDAARRRSGRRASAGP